MYLEANTIVNGLWARLNDGHDPISQGLEIRRREGLIDSEDTDFKSRWELHKRHEELAGAGSQLLVKYVVILVRQFSRCSCL
jgi:hypothetical protein